MCQSRKPPYLQRKFNDKYADYDKKIVELKIIVMRQVNTEDAHVI